MKTTALRNMKVGDKIAAVGARAKFAVLIQYMTRPLGTKFEGIADADNTFHVTRIK